MDSGTSYTMYSRQKWFTYFNPLSSPISVVLGDNHSILATGVSHIIVRMCANGEWKHQMLQNVLYVPGLHGNLLSIDCAAEVTFKLLLCHVYNHNGELICKEQKRGTAYIIDIEVPRPETAHITNVKVFPSEGDEMPMQVLATHPNVLKASLEM